MIMKNIIDPLGKVKMGDTVSKANLNFLHIV